MLLPFHTNYHPPQVLDHFMTEVGQRFSTRTEERLLAVVYTLQQRTYKTGLPASAPVPEVFKKELAGEARSPGGWLVGWLGCYFTARQAHAPAAVDISGLNCCKPPPPPPLLQGSARRAAAATRRRQVPGSWPTSSSSLLRTWTRPRPRPLRRSER